MWPSVTRYWLGSTIFLEVTINERSPSTNRIWSDQAGSHKGLSWGAHQQPKDSPYRQPWSQAMAIRNPVLRFEIPRAMMTHLWMQQSTWKPNIFTFRCCCLLWEYPAQFKQVATSFQPSWAGSMLKRKRPWKKPEKSTSKRNVVLKANPGSEERQDPDDLNI